MKQNSKPAPTRPIRPIHRFGPQVGEYVQGSTQSVDSQPFRQRMERYRTRFLRQSMGRAPKAQQGYISDGVIAALCAVAAAVMLALLLAERMA